MHKMKRFVTVAVGAGLAALPMVVGAQGTPLNTNDLLGKGLENVNLGKTQTLQGTIAGIINAALGFLGVIAVVIILLGGFMWMTAAGNEEKIKKARGLIVAGIVGLAIILSAWAIAKFVLNALIGATTTGQALQ